MKKVILGILVFCNSFCLGQYNIIDIKSTPKNITNALALGFTVNNSLNTISFNRDAVNKRYVRFNMNPLTGFEEVPYKIGLYNNGQLIEEFPETQNYYSFDLINDGDNVFEIKVKSPQQFQYTYTIYTISPFEGAVLERINDNGYEDSGLSVYPNPCGDILNFSTNSLKKVTIYDSVGKLIIIKYIYSYIDLHTLESGIYIFVVEDNNKKIIKKVIKNK